MKERKRVEVILKNKDGKILSGKNPRHGAAVFPGGGVDEGESLLEAAKREIQEETGKNVKNLKKVDIPPFNLNMRDTISSTSFVQGEVAGGRKSERFGADNDVLHELKFRTPKETEKFFIDNARPGFASALKSRVNLLKKVAMVATPGFQAGFRDGCLEFGIVKKADVDSLLRHAYLSHDLTKRADDAVYKSMLGAGIGSGLGSWLGYELTEDEEKKMKNALIGALVGAGSGGVLGYPGTAEKKAFEVQGYGPANSTQQDFMDDRYIAHKQTMDAMHQPDIPSLRLPNPGIPVKKPAPIYQKFKPEKQEIPRPASKV